MPPHKPASDEIPVFLSPGGWFSEDEAERIKAAFLKAQGSHPTLLVDDDPYSIRLRVTSVSTPFTMEGTIAGRPIWYRARGPRWELYEGTERAMSGVDADGHLTGDGVTWLATGETEDAESLADAMANIMAHCARWPPESA